MYAFKAESMLVSSMDWLSSSVSLKKMYRTLGDGTMAMREVGLWSSQ